MTDPNASESGMAGALSRLSADVLPGLVRGATDDLNKLATAHVEQLVGGGLLDGSLVTEAQAVSTTAADSDIVDAELDAEAAAADDALEAEARADAEADATAEAAASHAEVVEAQHDTDGDGIPDDQDDTPDGDPAADS